jgi:molybdopterin-guanine dinucleotide biosynthesis protein A
MIKLTCLLLAGGLSRRMGTDKATLVYKGEPLWSRQVRTLSKVGSEAIWVSAQSVPEWAKGVDEVILDEAPSRGPLSGICATLSLLETSHLLVLGIDLPNMTSEHLRELVNVIEPGRGVIPVKEERFETVCALYPREAVGVAKECLEKGRLSLQDFAKELEERKLVTRFGVRPTEEHLYLNVNAPMDLRAR